MTELPFDEGELMAELEQAIADLNAFASTFELPDGDVTEHDRRGVVAVTVSPGLSVTTITVLPTWEEKVPAPELALAVDEALGRATTRALGLDPDADAQPEPDARPAPITPQVRAEARRTIDQAERRLLDQAATMGRDFRAGEDRIDALVAQMESAITATELAQSPDALPDSPQRVYSANRMVSMATTGMSFMATDINQNWLKGRSGTAVTQCLAEILEQAPQDQAAGFAQVFRTAFGEA